MESIDIETILIIVAILLLVVSLWAIIKGSKGRSTRSSGGFDFDFFDGGGGGGDGGGGD